MLEMANMTMSLQLTNSVGFSAVYGSGSPGYGGAVGAGSTSGATNVRSISWKTCWVSNQKDIAYLAASYASITHSKMIT